MTGADRSPRVIVADDDEEMRTGVCELVAGLSVEVDPASSGCDLGLLLAADRPVDLLITDVRMPWLTGLQVAMAARNAGLQIPIVVITAFPDDEVQAKVKGLGQAVLLAKPFGSEDLLSLVRQLLAER